MGKAFQGELQSAVGVLKGMVGWLRENTDVVAKFGKGNLGKADEEYVQVLAADPDNQTFDAIFTKDHPMGATVRPTIWPTAILNEGDSLAFDILAVASPDPGADLTVVVQT